MRGKKLCRSNGILASSLQPEELCQNLKLSRSFLRCFQALDYIKQQISDKADLTIDNALLKIDRIEQIAGPHTADQILCIISVWLEVSNLSSQLFAQLQTIHQKYDYRRIRNLPINGRDLQNEFGLSGADIGEALILLRRKYYLGLWNHKSEGLSCIQEWMQAKKS